MRGVKCVVVVAAGALVVGFHGGAWAARSPVTVARAGGPLVAFAQSAAGLAWVSDVRCLGRVVVEPFGHRARVVDAILPQNCSSPRHRGYLDLTRLVLAGRRAAWTYFETGNEEYTYVLTAVPGQRHASELENPIWDMSPRGVGDHLGGLAAGGGAIAYSTVGVGVTPPNCDQTTGKCTPVISGGPSST